MGTESSAKIKGILCRGICKRKGCSQVGVRVFVETLFEKGVGARGSPTKTTPHPTLPRIALTPQFGASAPLPVGRFPAEAGRGDFKELDAVFGNLATHQSQALMSS